jgi:2-phosphoglycerate kinase
METKTVKGGGYVVIEDCYELFVCPGITIVMKTNRLKWAVYMYRISDNEFKIEFFTKSIRYKRSSRPTVRCIDV